MLVAGLAVSVTAQRPDASAVVIGLEHRLAQAWVSRDRPFIDGLLASDWTVTDPSGRILTKQQVLDETFSSTERRIDAMSVDDIRVRVLDDVAVATGRTRATGTYQGQKSNVLLRFTDVFHFREGRWQIVASQGTLIAP
jgi:ketosteroid isomerase-like protein